MTEEPQLPHVADVSPRDLVDHIAEPELKWRAVSVLEGALAFVCGVILVAFTSAVLLDVVTRAIGTPVSWLQNLIVGSFVWGIFLGAAVAQRRREHFRLAAIADHFTGLRQQLFESLEDLVVLVVAVWMAYFGYLNVLSGRHNYLQPSGVPLAFVTAAIPVTGLLIILFSIERLYHVWARPDLFDAGTSRGGVEGRPADAEGEVNGSE